MKKIAALAVALCMLFSAGSAYALKMTWAPTVTAGPGGAAIGTDWVAALYIVDSSVLPSSFVYQTGNMLPLFGNPSAPTPNSVAPVTTFSSWTLDSGEYFFDKSFTDSEVAGFGIGNGTKMYTVIFNSSLANLATATRFAVFENTVPYTVTLGSPAPPSFTYGGSGLYVDSASDWKDVVPEPATMTLLGLGALTLVVRRKFFA